MFVKNLLKGKKKVLEILKKEPEGRTFLLKDVVESVYAKNNRFVRRPDFRAPEGFDKFCLIKVCAGDFGCLLYCSFKTGQDHEKPGC